MIIAAPPYLAGDYAGRLLPRSRAPGILEVRNALHHQLRDAVLASNDGCLVRRRLDEPWGADDQALFEDVVGSRG